MSQCLTQTECSKQYQSEKINKKTQKCTLLINQEAAITSSLFLFKSCVWTRSCAPNLSTSQSQLNRMWRNRKILNMLVFLSGCHEATHVKQVVPKSAITHLILTFLNASIKMHFFKMFKVLNINKHLNYSVIFDSQICVSTWISLFNQHTIHHIIWSMMGDRCCHVSPFCSGEIRGAEFTTC